MSGTATFKPSGNGASIVARIREAAKLAVSQWAAKVLATADYLVPVDTGELKSSGHIVMTEEGSKVTASVVFDAPHAVYAEFGTGIRGAESPGAGPGPYSPSWPGMAAIPYLRPAIDQHTPEAVPMAKGAVKTVLG